MRHRRLRNGRRYDRPWRRLKLGLRFGRSHHHRRRYGSSRHGSGGNLGCANCEFIGRNARRGCAGAIRRTHADAGINCLALAAVFPIAMQDLHVFSLCCGTPPHSHPPSRRNRTLPVRPVVLLSSRRRIFPAGDLFCAQISERKIKECACGRISASQSPPVPPVVNVPPTKTNGSRVAGAAVCKNVNDSHQSTMLSRANKSAGFSRLRIRCTRSPSTSTSAARPRVL